MFDNEVLKRLENLPHLSVLRSRNISILSKSNIYHDSVKFFAQIDDKNVIRKISFKASGCTAFMLMCSYFCELVEGKKIDTALKVSINDLEKLMPLKESQKHVVDIILKTFALMITKYNKGVVKGTIIPMKSEEDNSKQNSTETKVIVVDESAKAKKLTKATKESNKINKKSTAKPQVVIPDNNEVVISVQNKDDTGYKTIETIETKKVYVDDKDNKVTEHVVTQKTVIETKDSKPSQNTQIIVDDNHKVHDIAQFSSMMDKLNKSKEKNKNINSLKANLSKIHVKNNQIIEERKMVSVEVDKQENLKKNKKGLFSWFSKNK